MIRGLVASFALASTADVATEARPSLRTERLALPALVPVHPLYRTVVASLPFELRYDALWDLDAAFSVKASAPAELRLTLEIAGAPPREVHGDGGADVAPLQLEQHFGAGSTARLVVTARSSDAVLLHVSVVEKDDAETLAKRRRPRSRADCPEWADLIARAAAKIEGQRLILDAAQQAQLAKALAAASESPDRVGDLFAALEATIFQTDADLDPEFWGAAVRFARKALSPDATTAVTAFARQGVALALREPSDEAIRFLLDAVLGLEHAGEPVTSSRSILARMNLARTCFDAGRNDSSRLDDALVPAATAAAAAARALSKKEAGGSEKEVRKYFEEALAILEQSLPFVLAPGAAIRSLHDELSREPEKLERTQAELEWCIARAEAGLREAGGDFGGSLDRYGELLEGAREKAAPDGVARWLARFERARLRYRVGACDAAQREFEALLAALPKGLPESEAARARANLQMIRLSKDDVAAAIQAIEATPESVPATLLESRDVAARRANLAMLLLENGEVADALEASKSALLEFERFPADFRDPTWIDAQVDHAQALVRAGEVEDARDFEAGALARWREAPGGFTEEACTLLNNHCFTLFRLRDWKGLAAALAELAKAVASSVDHLPALSTFEVTAAVQQRSTFLDTLYALTRELRRAAVRDPKAGVDGAQVADLDRGCFELTETFRTAWADDLRRIQQCVRSPDLYQQLQEWRRAAKDVSEVVAATARIGAAGSSGADVVHLIERRDDLARRISGELERLHFGRRHFDARRLEQELAPDEAALSFHVYQRDLRDEPDAPGKPKTEPVLCAFVVRRDGLHRIDDFGADYAGIEGAVRGWIDAHVPERARGEVGTKPASSKTPGVAALLLDPLLPLLPEGGLLYVCPDQCLHALPFEALELPKPKPADAGVHVADRFSILYEPSLVGLAEAPSDAGREPSLLVMGRPDLAPAPWTQIPPGGEAPIGVASASRGDCLGRFEECSEEMELEARAVAKGFAARFKTPAELKIGIDATKEAFLDAARNVRFLHLATHAAYFRALDETRDQEVASRAPLSLAVIAFAGANLTDPGGNRVFGLLSAEEIAGLDLRGCELAVVAACESAVGAQIPAQGVASLQTAFHVAGARNVVTALWKIPDTKTGRFMRYFYERLWSADAKPGRREILDAFRGARDRLRQERDVGLSDWAGIVLSGRG